MTVLIRASMTLVAVAAFALSFQSLMELGELAGYGNLAALYPICVDLGTVSSCAAWLVARSRQAFWMMWVLLGISVIQNGTVHWLLTTGQRPAWWLITLVATVPPGTLGLVVHLGVGLGVGPPIDGPPSLPVVADLRQRETGSKLEQVSPDPPAEVLAEKYPQVSDSMIQTDPSESVIAERDNKVVPDPAQGSDPPAKASSSLDEAFDPVAELIQQGAGRRTIAAELGVTEYKAKQLIASHRNGSSHVQA